MRYFMKIADVLYLIILITFTLICTSSIYYKSLAIDTERTQQLQSYINRIEDTKFKNYYENKILEFSQDSKISNSEFNELKDLHNKYVTSKAINIDILQNLEREDEQERIISNMVSFGFRLILVIAIIFIPLSMLRKIGY